MDFICVWFCRFCRIDIDPCKMRNPKDGFGCGDCHSNNRCIDFFLDHGDDHWIHRNNRLLKQQDMDVFNFIRIATGASWLCYFKALQPGDVNKVVPIDKSSTILTIILAFIFLGEPITPVKGIAVVLIGIGTFMMIQKKETVDEPEKSGRRSWLIYALLSTVFASLTAILGKIGIEGVESNLGTAIRTCVVLVMAWVVVFVKGKQYTIREIPKNEFGFICLSGLATGGSWLCYYRALHDGMASVVVPIDKLSILVSIAFSYIVFRERLTKKAVAGLCLIVVGTLIMLL